MKSIKRTFAKAAFGGSGSSTFWLLIWALAILDQAERREDEQRKKREREATPSPMRRPPTAPQP